ncbi:MAG: hypothetical protein AAGI25_13835 [Bacteroidota bacterium]
MFILGPIDQYSANGQVVEEVSEARHSQLINAHFEEKSGIVRSDNAALLFISG